MDLLSRWYNIPVDPSVKKTPEVASQVPAADIPATSVESIDEEETDSRPLNFETFVPTYDPSLPAPPVMTQDYVSDVPAGAVISQDEAFAKALNAMYWGGYWTAMYHVCIFSFPLLYADILTSVKFSVQPTKLPTSNFTEQCR